MAEDDLPGTGTEDGAGDSDNTGLIAAGVAALEAGAVTKRKAPFERCSPVNRTIPARCAVWGSSYI